MCERLRWCLCFVCRYVWPLSSTPHRPCGETYSHRLFVFQKCVDLKTFVWGLRGTDMGQCLHKSFKPKQKKHASFKINASNITIHHRYLPLPVFFNLSSPPRVAAIQSKCAAWTNLLTRIVVGFLISNMISTPDSAPMPLSFATFFFQTTFPTRYVRFLRLGWDRRTANCKYYSCIVQFLYMGFVFVFY